MQFSNIGIIGAGAWGIALAVSSQRAGINVRISTRSEDSTASLRNGGEQERLPGLAIPALDAGTGLAHLAKSDAVLMACPAQNARAVLTEFASHASPGLPIVLCAKGLERMSGKLMSEVLAETIPEAIPAVLSGPSFAADLARGLPAAVTLACPAPDCGAAMVETLGHKLFRPYLGSDIIGAQLGGVVKNVLAIACGIVTGLELGDSARASLIARGFAEMSRLGQSLGAQRETLAGLCGLGDLVLTCTSAQSRNMSFGIELGRGRKAKEILAERRAVTEGALSAPTVLAKARKANVEMPVCAAVTAVINDEISLAEAMDKLMRRPFTAEIPSVR